MYTDKPRRGGSPSEVLRKREPPLPSTNNKIPNIKTDEMRSQQTPQAIDPITANLGRIL